MFRRRDPAITKIVSLPWRSTDLCPCSSGDTYGQCCRQLSGSPYKKISDYKPSGASTGYSHPDCYMNWTRNCSRAISGEHFISKTVLSILNPTEVRIAGLAWTKGETRDLPIGALKANVLCVRHNSAWSELDAMAGKFFRAVGEIYDDLAQRTLSRKPIWHLFSGEELELWLLKTILGFFHAGVLTKGGKKIRDVQTVMNPAIEAAYHTGRLKEPCGIYLLKDVTLAAQRGSLEFESLSDERDARIVGCRLTMMGLVMTLFTDPNMLNRDLFIVNQSYRPDYLFFRNNRRRHSVVLTWPARQSRRAVMFKIGVSTPAPRSAGGGPPGLRNQF